MDEEEQSKQYNVNTTRDVNVSYSQHNVYSRPPCLLGNVRIKVFSNLPSSYFDFIPIIRAAHERLLAHQSCFHPAYFPRVGCLLFLDSLLVAVCSCCLFVRLVFESISAQTHLRKTHADRTHITKSVHWFSRQTGHGVTNSVMWWYDVKCVCHVWLWMFLMQYIEQKCHPLNSDTQIKRPRRRVVLFTTEWIGSVRFLNRKAPRKLLLCWVIVFVWIMASIAWIVTNTGFLYWYRYFQVNK